MLLDDKGLQERVARMETLLGEIEALKDPNARQKAAEIVQVLLELYGEGLARMMETVAQGEERVDARYSSRNHDSTCLFAAASPAPGHR